MLFGKERAMPSETHYENSIFNEEVSLDFLKGEEGAVFLKNVQRRHALEYADAWGFFDVSGLCPRISVFSEAKEAEFLKNFENRNLQDLLSSEVGNNMLFYLRYAAQKQIPLFRILEYGKREPQTFVIVFVHTPFVAAKKRVIAFFMQQTNSPGTSLFLEDEHEAFRREEIIRDIQRHGTLTSWTERELLFLGLSPETPYITCLVQKKTPLFNSKEKEEEENSSWCLKLSRCLLREHGLFCWKFRKKLGVLLVQKENTSLSLENQKNQGLLLLELCGEFFPGQHFLVGLGGKPRPLEHFCLSLAEAERACQGFLFGQNQRVVHFDDIGYGKLLDPQNREWQSFMEQTLKPFLPENEKNSVLLNSLEALLEHSSIVEAAEALHVHPNTLGYRKRQIQELLKTDLQDPHVRTSFFLALKARRLSLMNMHEESP